MQVFFDSLFGVPGLTDIIAQVFGIIGMAVIIISLQCKSNKAFFLMQGSGSLAFVLNFLLIGAFGSAFFNVACLTRGLLFMKNDKKKWKLILTEALFISSFVISAILDHSAKQLILTSDKPPVELKDIEQRLLTRFKWGLSAHLNVPDYETKVKIIRAKAKRLGANIPEEVVSYLAENISANVREIEGALSSLIANASFLGRKITISLAKDILKVYVKLTQREITIEHIVNIVCEYYNIDLDTFNSAKRTRDVAQARQVAMYMAKQHTKAPLTVIGSSIGGRNHATVLHSCKAVADTMDIDKVFKAQIEEIDRIILNKN
jgi:hypothetical protein